MNRESLQFGSGHFLSALKDQEFDALSPREQALLTGWANGCPVALELTDPNNSEPGRGPEAMGPRYGAVDNWFVFIGRAVAEVNPTLAEQFDASVERRDDEPVGPYEPESVPENYEKEMAPLGTIWGFAMPRLLIKQIGDDSVAKNQDRLMGGLTALESAAEQAATPAELLAIFAEELSTKGAISPAAILSGALPRGWLAEHNAISILEEVKKAFEDKAPKLWRVYESLSAEQKQQLKLA